MKDLDSAKALDVVRVYAGTPRPGLATNLTLYLWRLPAEATADRDPATLDETDGKLMARFDVRLDPTAGRTASFGGPYSESILFEDYKEKYRGPNGSLLTAAEIEDVIEDLAVRVEWLRQIERAVERAATPSALLHALARLPRVRYLIVDAGLDEHESES